MEVMCISGDRNMILHVLEREVGTVSRCDFSPGFACRVGCYTLLRDGRLIADNDAAGVFTILASLGLCRYPYSPPAPADNVIYYPMHTHSGKSLLNLFSILSARQRLLCPALGAKKKTFFIEKTLMNSLLMHPPRTIYEFLQALYGREAEFGGVTVNASYIAFPGFLKCRQEEAHIHRQLAEHIVHEALTREYIKAFTANIRNKKYAFRVWLNAIGMIGPEYEEARSVMLSRLYGKADRRAISRNISRNAHQSTPQSTP